MKSPSGVWSPALAGLLLVLLPFCDVRACGPDFAADTFVEPLRPDDSVSFAGGKLGILQATYFRRDLIVAYRYLLGGQLSPAEQASYAPATKVLTPEQAQQREDGGPANQWLAVRGKYAGAAQMKPSPPWESIETRPFPDAGSSNRYMGDFLNCPDDAFQTAVRTLQTRAKSFGSPSLPLSDWIAGQDAVFSNCTGKAATMPLAAGAAAPAILRADRNYQVAAANFYALRWSDAQRQFEAIAKEPVSPWRIYGGYLAARVMVRQAFFAKPLTDDSQLATFDPEGMAAAQQRLESLLADPAEARLHHAILAELNFVRLRTEQRQRLKELATALSGPKSDPNFEQDLSDLTFTLDNRFDQTNLREDSEDFRQGENTADYRGQAYKNGEQLRNELPLVDWLLTFQSPSEEAHQHALEMWNSTRSIPWLTAAIAKSMPQDQAAPALLAAAAELPQTSPAYVTVTFHRARLLISLHRGDEARALLNEELPAIRKSGTGSASNAFLGLRMQTAHNLAEFLADAPRKVLETSSSAAYLTTTCVPGTSPASQVCQPPFPPLQFDADAAAVLNFDLPLELLIRASEAPDLLEDLRQSIAMTAWARSVQLGDAAAAARLSPLLPVTVANTAGKSIDFPATLALLRNPGIRPYLDAGVQRSLTHSIRDEYRNNWWCADWSSTWLQSGYGRKIQLPKVQAPFLTDVESKQAETETTRLLAIPDSGSVYLGQRVLAYARSHPDDPDVAEALFLTVRATHFGCSTQEAEPRRLATAKAAFELLKKRYPDSRWAKMTKYYS